MDARDDVPMSLFEHLDELRTRIIRAVAGLLAAAAVSWVWSERLLKLLIRPPVEHLVFTRPTEPFFAQCKVALFSGLVLSLPWLLYQLWAFVSPGLKASERSIALRLIAPSYLLFLAGAGLGFFVVGPWSLRFLLSFSRDYLQAYLTLDHYLSYMSSLALGTGVLFQIPVLLYLLAKMGLVSARTLGRYRRHVALAILIAGAVVTPSPDLVGQLLISVPAYLLYEVSIVVVWLTERGKKAASA